MHVWRQGRRGERFVTVVIDLTPVCDRTGPARLLDIVEGRFSQVFKDWLSARPEAWRAGIEVVTMDGFTGFKTAGAEEVPEAIAVMDPFHSRPTRRRRARPLPSPGPAAAPRPPRPGRGLL